MRICFLAAGNSVHSFRWIRFFAERGYEIHWLSLTSCDFPSLPNTRFYDLSGNGSKWSTLARAAFGIRRLVREIAPDIMHAHYAGSYGLLGALSGLQPFVLSAWGSDILFAGKAPIRGVFIRWALNAARLITCDAYHMIEAMRALGTNPEKIRLIFFGVEVDRLLPGDKDEEIVTRWNAAGRRVIISLRNLEPVYNIETLLDAVPAVAKVMPEALFVIAGAGTAEKALKDHAVRLGIEDNVNFIGRYANSDLPRMLRSADVYVSTSLSDAGIAASTAEAMSCGVPAVISNTGENERWIVDGKDGFLVPAREPQTLAERIIRLLGDESLRRAVGLAGREVIDERDNYLREMQKVEGLYKELIHPDRGVR